MAQHPNDPVEHPQRWPEPNPEIGRARDQRGDEVTGLEDDEDLDEDVDPDSAASENDRDDTLTD